MSKTGITFLHYRYRIYPQKQHAKSRNSRRVTPMQDFLSENFFKFTNF